MGFLIRIAAVIVLIALALHGYFAALRFAHSRKEMNQPTPNKNTNLGDAMSGNGMKLTAYVLLVGLTLYVATLGAA